MGRERDLAAERAEREARGLAEAAAAPAMESEQWVTLAGAAGSVPALRLLPPGAPPDAAPNLFIHGGGWVYGSPLQTLGLARRIAAQTRRPLYSLRYRLAPEHPYPAAILDACVALDALADDGLAGVIGASAGAQVALGACLRQRDLGAPAPKALVLFNGAFAQHTATASHRAHGAGPEGLTTAIMAGHIADYAVAAAPDRRHGDLTRADLSGLPPAWFACGDQDPLLDDTLATFGAALAATGTARLHILPGRRHGFVADWRSDPMAEAALAAALDWLGEVSPR